MAYQFRDTTSRSSSNSLPTEALLLNGAYIENVFKNDDSLGASYKTLTVSGRELMAQEADTLNVGTRHGSFLKSRRFNPREITVAYMLSASDAVCFRKAYNKLSSLLNVEDSRLVFADESDKYFIGTVTEVSEVETGRNSVVGEFTFTCFDPFKYSVQQFTASPLENSFTIEYNGTAPAHPIIEIGFSGSGTLTNATFTLRGANIAVGPLAVASSTKIVASCEDASIKVGSTKRPDIGAISNAWDSFLLKQGSNSITYTASGISISPTIKYREVYL